MTGSEEEPGRGAPPVPEPLPAPVPDSHCHLDHTRGGRRNEVDSVEVTRAIELAARVGVDRIIQIGCDLEGARWAVRAVETHPSLLAGVALHPNEIPALAARGELDSALAEIERLATGDAKVRAIGETGLDHFRTDEPDWQVQREAFAAHVELAERLDKTLVIHDRDAHDDILKVLSEIGAPERVVMHCFSGDAEFAAECVRRGYFLSFAGTVTFKNAAALREACRIVPPELLLVETDAPYLTPHPYRGQANASYLIPLTMACISQVKEIDLATLCDRVSLATKRAFDY